MTAAPEPEDPRARVPAAPAEPPPTRVAYIVSRFPHVSETFIVRELSAVAEHRGVHVELCSLFPAVDPTVHPAARPWLGRLRRPGALAALLALAWWLRRRPLRLISTVGRVSAAHARRPAILVRALATVPLAAAHARTLASLGVDHIHAHFATYPALAAWTCRRLTGIGYSFTAHAHDLYVDQSHLREKVGDARFAVAVSEFNRRYLRAYGGDAATPVHVVHCGIDPGAYRFRPRAPAPAGPVRALCVASLQEYKGHRVLLEALAGAGGELRRLELDLVGGGVLREELAALAGRLGVADRVRFHGSLPEPEVAALLERADLFVLPSVVARNGQMEGLPVALMEALACGVPAVSTRLSGIPEIVRDGETGLLADPGGPASLRGALLRVLDDPAGARSRAVAGRRLVEREFDVRASGRRLAELFEHMSRDGAPAQGSDRRGR
ncbi:MAG: glycosyltransferase [Actinomycetota bacterium]|nr:glycosyltransferase [Actinomycetota bacterium]